PRVPHDLAGPVIEVNTRHIHIWTSRPITFTRFNRHSYLPFEPAAEFHGGRVIEEPGRGNRLCLESFAGRGAGLRISHEGTGCVKQGTCPDERPRTFSGGSFCLEHIGLGHVVGPFLIPRVNSSPLIFVSEAMCPCPAPDKGRGIEAHAPCPHRSKLCANEAGSLRATVLSIAVRDFLCLFCVEAGLLRVRLSNRGLI